VHLEQARTHAAESRPDANGAFADVHARRAEPPRRLLELLSDREKVGDITVAINATVAGDTVDVVVFEGNNIHTDGAPLTAPGEAAPVSPAREIAALREKIRFCVERMEKAIANHEFEKARFYSDQERRLREEMEQLRDRVPEEVADDSSADMAPFLCILILGGESLSRLRSHIEACLKAGVAYIWILDPADKRAYTATAGEGLREMTGDILRVAHPCLEIEWRRIFA
jgi:hypothetical protein